MQDKLGGVGMIEKIEPLGSPHLSPPTDMAWHLSKGKKALAEGSSTYPTIIIPFPPSGNRKQNSLGRMP